MNVAVAGFTVNAKKEKARILRLDREFLRLYLKGQKGSGPRRRANLIKRALEQNDGVWECRLCGEKFHHLVDVSIDHVVPLFFKAPGERHNVQLAHRHCNSRRGHMPIEFFFMVRALTKRFPDHIVDVLASKRRKREKKQRKRLNKDATLSVAEVT